MRKPERPLTNLLGDSEMKKLYNEACKSYEKRCEDLPKTALAAEIINNQKSAGVQEAVKELYGLDDLGGNPFFQNVADRMEQARRLEEVKHRCQEGGVEPFIKIDWAKNIKGLTPMRHCPNRKILLLEGV